MVSFRRPSQQLTAVLLALAEHPSTWRYAAGLCQRLDLTAGGLYSVLMRLADRGLLETSWEPEVPADQRPRHRYRLSGPGRALAGQLAAGRPSAPASPARVVGGIGRRPRLEDT
jgi:PadR family transcriptional regulator, regulatory protein PadR